MIITVWWLSLDSISQLVAVVCALSPWKPFYMIQSRDGWVHRPSACKLYRWFCLSWPPWYIWRVHVILCGSVLFMLIYCCSNVGCLHMILSTTASLRFYLFGVLATSQRDVLSPCRSFRLYPHSELVVLDRGRNKCPSRLSFYFLHINLKVSIHGLVSTIIFYFDRNCSYIWLYIIATSLIVMVATSVND